MSHLSTIESERATVVLAVPTCTYTGVRDIVDLAVARGGDVDLLESLTNNYIHNVHNKDNNNNKYYKNQEQWHSFLSDQMSTLKYALTRPNVQFLIYEVHTILPSETTQMVREVVDCVNQMAKEKYFREYPVSLLSLFLLIDIMQFTKLQNYILFFFIFYQRKKLKKKCQNWQKWTKNRKKMIISRYLKYYCKIQ